MGNSIQDRYEGDFLEAIDLPEGELVAVAIADIVSPSTEKDAQGKVIDKAMLAFKGKKKRLVLNKTNYRLCKMILGADPSKWIGKQVSVQRRYLDAKHAFGQQNEMCIRIIPPLKTPLPKSVRDYLGSKTPLE